MIPIFALTMIIALMVCVMALQYLVMLVISALMIFAIPPLVNATTKTILPLVMITRLAELEINALEACVNLKIDT